MAASSFKTYDYYANADLSEYSGQWVAICKNKVVAHGKNVKQILQEAEKVNPDCTPFIAKVPQKEILLW